MSSFVLLDSGPMGLLSHPRNGADIDRWVLAKARAGMIVTLPGIVDYEVRGELLRARQQRGLERLNSLRARLYFAPVTPEALAKAAEFWAAARQQGRPTADVHALDVDVILAAQAWEIENAGHEVVVATSNPRHLSLFTTARAWAEI